MFQKAVIDSGPLFSALVLNYDLRAIGYGRSPRFTHVLADPLRNTSAQRLRCPHAPENGRFPFEVRQLLYGRKPHVYRILFTIENETVYVLHIRHGRREHLAKH